MAAPLTIPPFYSRSVPELVDIQLQKHPNRPVYVYDNEDGSRTTINLGEYVPVLHLLAKHVAEVTRLPKGSVVALVGVPDSISFCAMLTAVARAEMIPFSISPRNTAAALARLFAQGNVDGIFLTDDVSATVYSAFSQMTFADGIHKLPTFVFPKYNDFLEELTSFADRTVALLPPMQSPEMDFIAFIFHTSGSTSEFSKPVRLTHLSYLQAAMTPYFGERQWRDEILACHALPPYLGSSVYLSTWPLLTEAAIAFFNPSAESQLPTAKSICRGIRDSGSTILLCLPFVLEMCFIDDECVQTLADLKLVAFLGAPLSKHIGDSLVKAGVSLASSYGSIETGPLSLIFPERTTPDWEYFKFSKKCDIHFTPYPGMPNVYSFTLVEIPFFPLVSSNVSVDGKRGYNLGDLVQRNPENPDLYKFIGRPDDEISLSDGRRINTTILEDLFLADDRVQFSVIFHRNNRLGAVLQLKPNCVINSADLVAFRKSIRPVIDETNRIGAEYQLPKLSSEMVILASPAKPFNLSNKMKPRRNIVLGMYQDEIEACG